MPKRHVDPRAVFLNIPYDEKFTNLYLAYIVGLSALGFVPKATLAIPGARRLDRICDLIESCAFSVHDLSRVQLDRKAPATPRFNMPFELGLAVSWSRRAAQHQWFVFETVLRRAQKSLSDLDGSDPFIHHGTVHGVMAAICDAFLRPSRQPTVPEMMWIYRRLRRELQNIRRNAGSNSLFTARAFAELSLAAAGLVRKYVL